MGPREEGCCGAATDRTRALVRTEVSGLVARRQRQSSGLTIALKISWLRTSRWAYGLDRGDVGSVRSQRSRQPHSGFGRIA